MKYLVTDLDDWIIIHISGKPENNEPLLVRHLMKHLFDRSRGTRVVVNLRGAEQLGVWEAGVLASLKKNVELRGGILRVCNVEGVPTVWFQESRFMGRFEVYPDLKGAVTERT